MKPEKPKPGRRTRCPSCKNPYKKGNLRCDICGADLSSDSGVVSYLSDTELEQKLGRDTKKLTYLRGGAVLSVLLAVVGFSIMLPALIIAAGLAFIVLMFISFLTSWRIKALVSANIVREALSDIIKLESFSPQDHIRSDIIESTNLIDGWNECSGSDLVHGEYRGSEIFFSDITLVDVQRYTDSDGNTHETRTTLFEGQWVICRLGKKINHRLRLRENREKLFGKGYRKAKSTVETENIAFNEKFQILADDPHTAFYILTPHFMEYINSADAVAKGQTYLCFDGDWVHFAVGNNRDLFEVKTTERALQDIPALRARIKSEVRFITDIIDELMLNN